jgi:hypothetical protein
MRQQEQHDEMPCISCAARGDQGFAHAAEFESTS